MNNLEMISIGFGNSSGQTSDVLITEHKSRIEIVNMKATHVEAPKIRAKNMEGVKIGVLKECLQKKRDEYTLKQLLRVDINYDISEIETSCKTIQQKIANDLIVLEAMMENKVSDQFMERTKSNEEEANRYLKKYHNLDSAVTVYMKHQEVIKKFMNDQQCSKEIAVNFLQANDYNYEAFN